MQVRQRYTKEFKLEAIRQLKEGNKQRPRSRLSQFSGHF